MSKHIVTLGINKGDNNGSSCPQLSCLHSSLLIRIFDTNEKHLFNVEGKSDTKKVRTSLVNSSSTLFSCSIRAMYNRVYRAQNKYLMFKWYITGLNTEILPNKH